MRFMTNRKTIRKRWRFRSTRKRRLNWGNTRWGEKSRTDSQGNVPKALDHDPPAKEKLVPLGILTLATGALTLCFGHHETSDFWADCLQHWWTQIRAQHRGVR